MIVADSGWIGGGELRIVADSGIATEHIGHKDYQNKLPYTKTPKVKLWAQIALSCGT